MCALNPKPYIIKSVSLDKPSYPPGWGENDQYLTLDDVLDDSGEVFKVGVTNLFLQQVPARGGTRPSIQCVDGFTASIQASSIHHSEPALLRAGYYRSVELGFPSEKDLLLVPYEDNKDRNIFPFVPVEIVDRLIAKHGGWGGKLGPSSPPAPLLSKDEYISLED